MEVIRYSLRVNTSRKMLFYSSRTSSVSQAKILNDIINKKLFTIRINSFLLVSLLSDSNQRPPRFLGQVRFLNASSNSFPVNISIDGTPYAVNSRFGTISTYDWISDGFHTVTVRRTNGLRSVLLQQNFPFIAGQKITMILTDSAFGGLEMIRVSDMGCTNLPSGSGCYRFANMTCSGSRFDLLLYGGETVFRNVGFQSVTPYKQAMAGSYQFYITSSSSYTFLKEIPVLVLGAIGIGSNLPQPLVSFQTDIASGRNYTSYLIGNTWSDLGLRVMTVEDNV